MEKSILLAHKQAVEKKRLWLDYCDDVKVVALLLLLLLQLLLLTQRKNLVCFAKTKSCEGRRDYPWNCGSLRDEGEDVGGRSQVAPPPPPPLQILILLHLLGGGGGGGGGRKNNSSRETPSDFLSFFWGGGGAFLPKPWILYSGLSGKKCV